MNEVAFIRSIPFWCKMSSIPFKPKRPPNVDVGPTYYNPAQQKTNDISTSNKGLSFMSSTVDRFPIQHDHWGYPAPGQYNNRE